MKKLASFLLPLFFILSTCSPNPDFEALQSFKTSSSSSSDSLSSWSNSTHLCSWLGVTCNPKTNRVNKLVLENLNLVGSIDVLTQLTHLRLLSLKYNNLSSSSTLDFSFLQNLKLLYLSHNRFAGKFPEGITELRHLHRIDLSYNQFSGEIPLTRLTELPQLLTVHLEANSFTGLLQSSSQVDFFKTIVEFNVSLNNLYGEIPKPLSFFEVSSFTGNKNLYGKPLVNKCLNQSIQNDPMPVVIIGHDEKKKKFSGKSILVIFLIDFSIVAVIGISIFFCCRMMKQRSGIKKTNLQLKKKSGEENGRDENEEVVFFEGSKRFKVDELLKSSAEMLGKGIVGTTYKVNMDNGAVVVVKRAKEKRRKKEIEGLLKEIGGLRNSHIVSLRAYYCSKDELLLVYDFLPNGSLHCLLHGNRGPGRTPLNWTTRLKFALDVAEGLVFLHNTSKSKLSHGHLTSMNIVINQQGNACISDVALHQLFLIATPTNNAYTAPELLLTDRNSRKSSESRKFSEKSDVYSFGLILLEILTGRLAESGGETDLVKWVQSVAREEGTSEVFDFELLRYKEMEKEMVSLLHVALLCLAPVPRDRPKISIIHKMIKDIKGRDL
ncbi:hypothetical protein ACHQM5_001804 [Ranunculus cassubicifolius]